MFAVIKAGGKQYQVKAGDKLKIEKLEDAVASEISFAPLLLAEEDASMVEVGKPEVKGHRRMGVMLATGKSVADARKKAMAGAKKIRVVEG